VAHRRTCLRALTIWTLSCWGCGGHPESSAVAELSVSPEAQGPTDSPTGAAAGNALDAALTAEAKAQAKGMVADGEAIRGELATGGRDDRLLVLRGGFCYRVFGVGAPSVEDLDLFLYDPRGVQTHQDPAQDRFPVLGTQGEICPTASGAYRLQALMYKGSGAYALRVYRTP
jgi:hypothetical protein